MNSKPFLTFYGNNQISPVTQDISDYKNHLQRREALYRHLGLPKGFFKDKKILEIGPGTGQNALFMLEQNPEKLTLLDGNKKSIITSKKTLKNHSNYPKVNFIETDFVDFNPESKFDIVLCEGVIPFQKNPKNFALKVSQNLFRNGILILTTIDSISFLGELLRRLIAYKIIDTSHSISKRLNKLRPVFSSHLKTLPAKTRLIDDWIYDNILIPYTGNLFSIADAIECLDKELNFYNSSPKFMSDWRWYKQIIDAETNNNEIFIQQYFSNVLNFIDYRESYFLHSQEIGIKILSLASILFKKMVELEKTNKPILMTECVDLLTQIIVQYDKVKPQTVLALKSVNNFLRNNKKADPKNELKDFESFFGRGQQYLSFIKK